MFIALCPTQHRAPEECHVHSAKWKFCVLRMSRENEISSEHVTHGTPPERDVE